MLKEMNYFYWILAFLAGMVLPAQAAINNRLGISLGGQPLMAALVSFAVGTLCLLVVAVCLADWHVVFSPSNAQSTELPWWRWLGGVMGAMFVFMSVFLAPKIGVTNTMFLFILGQLSMGMMIDSFGWLQMPIRPAYWWKFGGLAIMLAGLVLFVFGEKWFGKN